jgi:hypothetical protein
MMRPHSIKRPIAALLPAGVVVLLAACGGGSGSSAPTATIGGSVFAAHIAGAGVTVRNATGVTIAGPVTTDSSGAFRVAIPDTALAEALRFESSGGSFTDEATGSPTSGGRLAAYAAAGTLGAGSAVHLTPSSTVVHDLVAAGKTLSQANAVFVAAFGFADNVGMAPMNDNGFSGTDNAAKRLAGLRAAAYSQLTKDMGFAAGSQFDLINAIARDLSDGALDGKDGSSPVSISPGNPLPEDILNRYGCAVKKFMDNTAINRTGLTAGEIGDLPFGKVALTTSLRIEYLPGMMGATEGKTAFRLKVTSRGDGSNVTGAAVELIPKMYMSGMSHASPADNSVADHGDGTYGCTVYFLMGSGPNMGYMELNVAINGETATFYPPVGMAMGAGNTVRVNLKGWNDNVAGMMGPEQRTYYLFRDELSGTPGNHAFGLFIAARESMLSMPPLVAGSTLHDAQNAAWTVSGIVVEASTDGSNWITGTNIAGTGRWSVSGLTGLASGTAGHVYVRLFVNGEQKTTDGYPPSGTNVFADFTVTP